MIVTGRVVGVKVTEAKTDYLQGIKGNRMGRSYHHGVVHVRNGFGGQFDFTPKRITVLVEVGNETTEVWVDQEFRYEIGKLTKKRTKAICEATPNVVELYENESKKGEKFYCLTEATLKKWLRDSGI